MHNKEFQFDIHSKMSCSESDSLAELMRLTNVIVGVHEPKRKAAMFKIGSVVVVLPVSTESETLKMYEEASMNFSKAHAAEGSQSIHARTCRYKRHSKSSQLYDHCEPNSQKGKF